MATSDCRKRTKNVTPLLLATRVQTKAIYRNEDPNGTNNVTMIWPSLANALQKRLNILKDPSLGRQTGIDKLLLDRTSNNHENSGIIWWNSSQDKWLTLIAAGMFQNTNANSKDHGMTHPPQSLLPARCIKGIDASHKDRKALSISRDSLKLRMPGSLQTQANNPAAARI